MRLYVGNLPFSTDDNALRALFEPHGSVSAVTVVTDRHTGRSRGFGFVEMVEDTHADLAMEALNAQQIEGRPLVVNEARPREERTRIGRPRRSRGGRRARSAAV